MILRGASVKDSVAANWLGKIAPVCRQGEVVTLIARLSSFKPLCDGLVVTNVRVMAASVQDLSKRGPKVALELGDVTRIAVAARASGKFLVLTDRAGKEHSFGRFAHDSDIDLVRRHLGAMAPGAHLVVETPTETPTGPPTKTTTRSFLGTVTTTTGLGSGLEAEFNGRESPTQPPTPQVSAASAEKPAAPPEGFVAYGSQRPPDPRPRFDGSRPPKPGDPVPADCVWATRKHPGPMPGRATFGNFAKRMRVMGDPTARTEAEIVSALGRPQSRSVIGAAGSYLLQWQHTSNWSYNSHFALQFDPYGVCAGITHQWQSL
ncbi:hypothetical protein [Rhodococcus jostii]|uniref:hypothetical protein n=1 Tax=Rhodococcus jostii TaxID=132919 RepID=UPI003658E10E